MGWNFIVVAAITSNCFVHCESRNPFMPAGRANSVTWMWRTRETKFQSSKTAVGRLQTASVRMAS